MLGLVREKRDYIPPPKIMGAILPTCMGKGQGVRMDPEVAGSRGLKQKVVQVRAYQHGNILLGDHLTPWQRPRKQC